MSGPNAQLEAALVAFRRQPGVSPQQVAQLRNAIGAPPALTPALNQDAAAGRLTGLALGAPGDSRVGRYDPASGIITLPAELLPGSGPATDLRSALKLQDMSLRFAHLPGVTPEMHGNLQKTLNDSPALADQCKAAVRDHSPRNLEGFALHTEGVAGGSYNPRTGAMQLTPASLDPATFRQHDLAFVMGHEMQHGANRVTLKQAREAFHLQLRAIASDSNPVNDYTAPIATMMAANRRDEASSHIAGWNAMLSYEKQRSGNPNAGFQEMWDNASRGRVQDFLELDSTGKPVPRAGLTFNPDGSLPSTPQNVEAMGRYYFDQRPVGTPGVPVEDTMGIGATGRSDYRNYYGTGHVGTAIAYERAVGVAKHGNASRMQLDLQALGLSEKLIEENGLSIAPGGTTSQAYRDTGTTPPTTGRFDHTRDGPHANQHVPAEPGAPQPGAPRGAASVNALTDDPMYRQTQSAVHRLDAEMGRVPDAASDAMTASLFNLARQNGLQRVDHVVLSIDNGAVRRGENVFVVQGEINDAANRIGFMKTADAVSTPPARSLEQAAQLTPDAPHHQAVQAHQASQQQAPVLSLVR